MDFLALALATASLALTGLLLHKVRKIHLATFPIQTHALTASRESTALFAQIQALLALDKLLGLPMPLPRLRGWAGSPDFLLYIAQHVLTEKAVTVVECSSGSSTVVAARCVQLNGRGHVFSLEHDAGYAEETRRMLSLQGLQSFATVVLAPLEASTDGTVWYRESALPGGIGAIDLLIVDGPPRRSAPMARYPALPRLIGRASNKFTLMLDDASRPDERAIVDRWLKEYPEFEGRTLPFEKGLAVLSLRGAPREVETEAAATQAGHAAA